MVEHLLPKQVVAGSNPVSRSMATYPRGKGGVCKTLIQRFESARRLHFTSNPQTYGLVCNPDTSGRVRSSPPFYFQPTGLSQTMKMKDKPLERPHLLLHGCLN